MKDNHDFISFARCALLIANTLAKRAIVFVYFRSRFKGGGAKIEDIVDDFNTAGLSRPQPSKLRHILTADRRTKRTATDTWMIPADRFGDIEIEFELGKCLSSSPEKNVGSLPVTRHDNRQVTSFVDEERISALRKVTSSDYDSCRLIQICIEINDNFSRKNYISVILLVRVLLDHVAPVFGFNKFAEVASNLKSTKSLKDSLQHLENSSRKIADGHLHTPIRKKEVLPTAVQVNFSQDLDVVLSEIVRILK